MKKHHILSIILSLLLCLSLCLSMLPYAALAEEGSGTDPAVDPIVSPAGENVTLPPEEENQEEGEQEAPPEGGENIEEPTPQLEQKPVPEQEQVPPQNTEAGGTGGGENPGETASGTEETGTEETPVQAEEIILNYESASLDALDTLQLSAQVYPEGCDQSVIWESSDPSVAVVDANGLVTAVGRGEAGSRMATITATAAAAAADGSELTASCYITVRSDGRRVERVEELGSEHPYRDGESRFWEFTLEGAENLALTFAPETSLGIGDFLLLQFGDNEQITYTADNIADLAGQTLAIPGDGLRIWLISDDDGNSGWGFQVTEAAAAEEGDELAQSQDFADPLKDINSPRLMGADLGAADTNAVAGGLLGAGKQGTVPTASVTLSATELSMEALDTVLLTATIDPADKQNLSVQWSSENESVAVVVDGEVQAQTTHGVTVITATVMYSDKSKSEDVEVKDANGQPAAASCTVTVTNDAIVVTDVAGLESEHNYPRPVNQFWQYTSPGATSITLTFHGKSELAVPNTISQPDTLIVTDGSKNQAAVYVGNLMADRTVTVNDDTVRIYLKSTETGPGAWGFKVSNLHASNAAPTYTVRYYANGGTNPPEQQTKQQDVPLTLSEETPTRQHYTFKGWATERNSGRVAWYPGDVYDINENLVLYAVWDRVSTFNSSNRGSSGSTPYYGPTGSSTASQSYPRTPIDLERPESNYDKEVLHIRTVEDLIAFSENCSLDTWSDHLPVVLDNDLSLSDVDFQPIPLFNGSFDGRGHSIFDVSLTDPLAPCGFFLETGMDAIVKNLAVTGTVMPGGDNNMTGGLVGLNRGCVLNCSFSGTVAGKLETGGLVGRNEVTGIVTGCRSTATVSGLSQIGGVCGVNYGTLVSCDSSCYVNTESVDPSLQLDDIDTSSLLNFFHSLTTETAGITTDSGGVCGYNEGFIEYCVSREAVGYSRLGYNVGGVAGRSRGYINGSRNEGAVYGRKDVGGIVGQAEPYIEVTQPTNLTGALSYRMYALHESINDAIHDADVLSSDISGQLEGLSGFLNPIEQAFRELSIMDPDSVTNLRTVIVDTVSGMAGQIQSMSASLGEGSGVLKQDLEAISNNLDALSGSALQTVDLLASSQNEDLIVDESASATADAITLGKITDCRNVGEVTGETNVGGIAGVMALENALDPELDLTGTDAVLRKRFSYRSVVSRSVNDAAINAWYECVGGIVGKADIGYITNCAAYGSAGLEDGAYAGGIAGLSYGTVQSCVSRCSLSGTKYVGGILGNGYTATGKDDQPSVVSTSYSLVEIEGRPQFSGAISGGAEGEYQENYFVPAGFAGLNKLSVYGKAEPILFSVFNSVVTLPEESKIFTLRFVVDGETVKTVNFEYGASFGREVFPEVETRDGAYAVWDRTDLTDLRFDTTVTAEYRRSETALGSELTRENGRPAVYVIGQFQEGDAISTETLPVEEREVDRFRTGWLQTAKEQILSIFHEPDYSLCVDVKEKLKIEIPEDGQPTHTIHYMTPDALTADYRLYLKTEDGYERIRPEVFGSYYSFEAPGNAPEITLVSTVQSWWFLAYLAGFLLILILLIRILAAIVRKLRNAPRKPKSPKAEDRLRTWIRSHRKVFTLLCIALVGAALIIMLLLQTGWLQSGFAGYRALRALTTQETDFESEIHLQMDDEEIELSSTLQQISEGGNMIICADQYGIDLYIANGTLYLENGRAFKLVSSQIDQRNLLRLALNAVRKGHVVREKLDGMERYSTEIDSETVEQILSLYLSEDFDAVFSGDQLHAEMDVQGGTLTQIRLTGEGSTENGTSFRFEGSFRPQPLSERPAVPQAVLDAIASGGEGREFMTGDMLRLFAAWFKNDRAETLDATITVNADCGVLSLDDSYSYFRQKVEGKDINCVSSRLFRVYFTDQASCTSDGKVLSTAETRLLDAAQLIPLMREMFLQGNYSIEELGSGQLYTLTVEADKIGGIVESVIPELKDLNIAYQDCSLSASVRDGSLYSLELQCGGNVKIVTRDVDASAEVLIRFVSPSDHVIPAAAVKALLHADEAA